MLTLEDCLTELPETCRSHLATVGQQWASMPRRGELTKALRITTRRGVYRPHTVLRMLKAVWMRAIPNTAGGLRPQSYRGRRHYDVSPRVGSGAAYSLVMARRGKG
jgi:hypothetical protein